MARRKDIWVRESQDHLDNLLQFNSGGTLELRLQMLQLYRNNPSLTLKQVGDRIGCNEKSIRRWLTIYQAEGLESLLHITDSHPKTAELTSNSTSSPTLPVQVIQFLNRLPSTENTVEWINSFRDALQRLLPDVDRISISIETECDLYSTEYKEKEILVSQYVMEAGSRYCVGEVTTQRMEGSPAKHLMANLYTHGFAFNEYHTPHSIDYHTTVGAYLGTILLWRERHRYPTSKETLETVEQLKPFLCFMLSDCIARRRRDRPEVQLFSLLINSISNTKELTTRQKEVMIHRILGRTHKEISAHLNISVNTIQDHMKEIYRRCGVTTFAELLARYFAPLGTN